MTQNLLKQLQCFLKKQFYNFFFFLVWSAEKLRWVLKWTAFEFRGENFLRNPLYLIAQGALCPHVKQHADRLHFERARVSSAISFEQLW